MSTTYRPPRRCPVCTDRLHVTQLGCPTCGTGLSGDFEPCEYCGLDDADRAMLRVFLSSRGNMKEVERHLGVSYPTARARFDDLLERLGMAGDGPAAPAADTGTTDAESRLTTLRALAAGDVDIDAARAQLTTEPDPASKPKRPRTKR